ncbi:MAG: YciI family protein [Acidobacteriota bacterium]
MANYMLVLRDEPTAFEGMGPEEMQRIIARYTAWSEALAAKGQLVDGNKLVDEAGRVVRRTGGQLRVVDGPFAEAKEIVGGYFTVEAESYDAAVEIASDCPHLDYGSVEIREVDADH